MFMKYLKNFNDLIIENYNAKNEYIEEINDHIRDNDLEFFKNTILYGYENVYIIIATMYGYTEIVKILVKQFDVNQTTHNDRNAAYFTRNKPEILRILIDNGLDLEHKDDWDQTFFDIISVKTLEKIKDNKNIKNYLRNKKREKFNL